MLESVSVLAAIVTTASSAAPSGVTLQVGTLALPTVQEVAVSVHVEDGSKLARVARLEDDWDGEGAPKPDRAALVAADAVTRWAAQNGLVISDVDADVIGGVAVWLKAYGTGPERSAWIACMNDGHHTVVCSEGTTVVEHAPWVGTDRQKAELRDFLTGSRNAAARA